MFLWGDLDGFDQGKSYPPCRVYCGKRRDGAGSCKGFRDSKSTVHKDMTGRLLHYDSVLFEEVRRVLERNKAERHIRGGLATREKYLILNRAGKK